MVSEQTQPDTARIGGLFAAMVTPIDDGGRLDIETFDRLTDFVVGAGVDGICVAGATGEYPQFGVADRRRLVQRAAARMPADRGLLVGIGASTADATVELGCIAVDAGARAVLLPMPMFFRYEQPDLAVYCLEVSGALRAPCLLYNLPAFTNGLTADTITELLGSAEHLAGVKDSSGAEANIERLASDRGTRSYSLLVGDDQLLKTGLEAGWDGGISGVAAFCPELLLGLYDSVQAGRLPEADRLDALLKELIERIAVFPVPWGIRFGLAARGAPTGPMPLPLTAERRRQVEEFVAWFPRWMVEQQIVRTPRDVMIVRR